jgi:hypothetical protein
VAIGVHSWANIRSVLASAMDIRGQWVACLDPNLLPTFTADSTENTDKSPAFGIRAICGIRGSIPFAGAPNFDPFDHGLRGFHGSQTFTIRSHAKSQNRKGGGSIYR